MKIIYLAMVMTLSLSVTLLVTIQHASADTCSAKLTSYNAPQFYLLSDEVFVGTVQHIDNATNHQWKVYFTVDKIWRGTVGQKPLIVMTNDLQGCGYSIAQGEKYLVYTNGYPPFFNTVWSKPYADAQNDIAIIDDPKFQSDEKAQEELNKKLVIARDAISNLMESKMRTIPFNSVGVDVINSTLDIGIDSAKAVLSEEEYEKKIKDIIGDIPIKITFGQIVTDAPILDTLSSKNSVPISLSPLQQFRSGVATNDVKCREGLMLIAKTSDGYPACVKSDTSKILIARGWATILGISFGGPTYVINDTRVSQKENSTSALKLYMYTNSDILQPGQSIGITISVNNTLETPVDVASQNNWSYSGANTGPCFTIGYGVSILDGFYDENNMSEGKILNLFNPGILCPFVQETAKAYEFQPHSGYVKESQCKSIEGIQCRTDMYQMGQDYKFDGYWDEGVVKPFTSGMYTIVGADEWGHVALDHFVVTNSTTFAGNLGSMSCPLMYGGIQFGASIKNFTGFAHYYNSEQYGNLFFLHKGSTGTINVQYDAPVNASWFQNNNNESINMTNGAALYYMANETIGKTTIPFAVSLYSGETGYHSQICHYGEQPRGGFAEPCNEDNKGDIPTGELPYASKLLKPGIMTSFEPNSVMLYPGSTPVFTTTVFVSPDAIAGTYWLSLERNLCGPGVLVRLVILP
ncbi:MAG: hypothetical protein PXX83_09440 [Candidatus Nitrosotalea sp.]|nr:hypothetical protein [Candidatus Nitrosotalea sp.]